MIKILFSIFAAAAAIAIAGCSGSGGGSSSELAGLAPPLTPVFIEGTVQPTGKLKSNVEAIARNIAGIDDLRAKIVAELESPAHDEGEPIDFEKEVEPWLGDKAGVFLENFDGDDFKDSGVLLETTNPTAAQRFLDKRAEASSKTFKDASYEGVDYRVDAADGTAVGVVGESLVMGKDEKAFKDAVAASNGDSLADEDGYSTAVSEKTPGSLATVYVDIGRLTEGAGGGIDDQTSQLLEGAGFDPSGSTALASVVPGPDAIEIDISGDFGGEGSALGNAPKMLESLPADSVVALSGTGFGERLEEAIDSLDAEGIPGSVPPHQLKSGLQAIGIDLDAIAGSIGEAGVFAIGDSESSLAGAAVLETDSGQATKVIADLGTLLRSTKAPGVTAVTGQASGFSIRSPRLGKKPLVVATKGGLIAIGYGLPATLEGLDSGSGATLSGSPAFKQAVSALGSTPIGGFVDGPAALPLAESLVPPSASDGFQKAKKYLKKIGFIAIGTASSGEPTTVKAIVGLEK